MTKVRQFRPMLAGTVESLDAIKFPVIGSPKLDGIRCVIHEGKALSRSLKPIPNIAVRSALEAVLEIDGLDGELMIDGASFQEITSGFMSQLNQAPAGWYLAVFDVVLAELDHSDYEIRHSILEKRVRDASVLSSICNRVRLVPHRVLKNVDELNAYEEEVLAQGHEGVMLRSFVAPYKFGRSTVKEGGLLKLKRFEDSEAEISGFVERMHNSNEATVSELGLTKRSSAKAGKVGTGTLGALVVRDLKTRVEFEVGTGFTEEQRVQLWGTRPLLIGRIVKYKHFAASGVKDKPRFPVFLGFRSLEDM